MSKYWECGPNRSANHGGLKIAYHAFLWWTVLAITSVYDLNICPLPNNINNDTITSPKHVGATGSMYITYISVSMSIPWAVTGPHGKLVSSVIIPLYFVTILCKDHAYISSRCNTDVYVSLDLWYIDYRYLQYWVTCLSVQSIHDHYWGQSSGVFYAWVYSHLHRDHTPLSPH